MNWKTGLKSKINWINLLPGDLIYRSGQIYLIISTCLKTEYQWDEFSYKNINLLDIKTSKLSNENRYLHCSEYVVGRLI